MFFWAAALADAGAARVPDAEGAVEAVDVEEEGEEEAGGGVLLQAPRRAAAQRAALSAVNFI